MTTFTVNRRQQLSLAVWPVVAFACFALGGLRALIVSLSQVGATPTFGSIVGSIDWSRDVLYAIALAAPAGLIALAQGRLERVRYVDSALVAVIVAAAMLGALWYAYQMAPDLVVASVGNVPSALASPR